MKILVCLPRFPYPLNKGDKLRAFFQIKELSKSNEIYLFCLAHKQIEAKDMAILQEYCKQIHIEKLNRFAQILSLLKSFFTPLPLQVAFFSTKKAIKEFKLFAEETKCDIAYFQFVRSAEYAKAIKIKSVLDFQDCLSMNMKRRAEKSNFIARQVFGYEAKKLQKYEEKMFGIFSRLCIITETDRDLLSSDLRNEVAIIENGVGEAFLNYTTQHNKEYNLIFSGNMSYAPNIDAAKYLIKSIMPIVWKKYPDTKVVLAGSNPTKEVRALAGEKVIVTGWVDDMREYYAKSKIFIAPMRIGTGLQNKLLEAMAMSLPCITTSLANNALKSEEGQDILIGNTASQLAHCITELMENEILYKNLAINSRCFVEKNYNWQNSTNKLQNIMYKAVSTK